MNKFTAADATALTKSERGYTPKGKIIDAIKSAAKKGETTISLAEYRVSDTTIAEFKADGFLTGVGAISWGIVEEAAKDAQL
tara:strand:+ start:235 stop:480 length:246 start_codon:yes stop_codon:yes gene_type:complete